MNIGANGKISIDGKVMREKPGFFKRMWHSMKSGSISKASLANPAVSQFLYETKNHIFGMGLTEDETNKVAQELRTIIRCQRIGFFLSQGLGPLIVFGCALNHLDWHGSIGGVVLVEVQYPLQAGCKVAGS